MKLYGIPNCDTVRKARAWLDQHAIALSFHDFRKQGVPAELAQHWLEQLGWQQLINRKGLTWRALSQQRKDTIDNNLAALQLMVEQPSIIRRPLLEQQGRVLHLGYDPASYAKIFNL
ncbi:MAG: ArsC family reductase [Pseudomonadota bacterium]